MCLKRTLGPKTSSLAVGEQFVPEMLVAEKTQIVTTGERRQQTTRKALLHCSLSV